jgi:phosphinothricin acetyltransferase
VVVVFAFRLLPFAFSVMLIIRPATLEHIPAITAIYNEAIRTTTATFDTEEKTEADRAEWLAVHDARHPVIVAVATGGAAAANPETNRARAAGANEAPALPGNEKHEATDGEVVGWAALWPFSDRRAYADTAENSVYVRSDWRGRGAGRLLLAATLAAARRAALHAIVARIAGENVASIRLHESLGFFRVGTLREVGRKFGRLIDVALLECLIEKDEGGRMKDESEK